ncbi:MAG: hypothetical protein U0441_30680 [Polyangiaceae bacterium]
MDNISFDCKLTQKPDALVVEYTIKNERSEDIGVFNRISGTAIDGARDFSPNNVYREIEGEVLKLQHIALPIPPGLRMAAYVPPHATRIAAGKSVTETFVVPVPVAVRQPYLRAKVSGAGGEVIPAKPVTLREVDVVIGIFPLTETGLVAEHPAFPDVLTVQPPYPALSGQVKLGARFTLDPAVTVLDYELFPWP